MFVVGRLGHSPAARGSQKKIQQATYIENDKMLLHGQANDTPLTLCIIFLTPGARHVTSLRVDLPVGESSPNS